MALQGKDVLIVDDSTEVRLLFRRMLENFGMRVQEAGSVEESLEFLRDRTPHLVLLDLQMPGMSGFDFLSRRDADIRLSGIPTIVISSSRDRDTVYRAIGLGASDYVIKPCSASVLAQKVRKHVRSMEFSRKRFAPEARPTGKASISARVTGIDETSFNLESAVRLSERSLVEISESTHLDLGIPGKRLQTAGRPGAILESGLYLSRVDVIAIAKSLLRGGSGG